MEKIKEDLQIEESSTIEHEKVKLNRCWSFWENYETKNKKDLEYKDSLKEIYSFDDIISFWQFWNKYLGADPKKIFFNGEYITYFFKQKYRITAMNLFEKGIRPEWEDKNNEEGRIFILEYLIGNNNEIDNFYNSATKLWTELICILIGETIPYSKYINGIRFSDKTRIGKSTIFRFEIWTNKSISENEVTELKSFLSNKFGCSATVKKIRTN